MKQQLSFAYIRAVVSTAGLTIGSYEEDYDGIDMTVRSFADFGVTRGASLDVQLKCSAGAGVLDSTHAKFTLKRHGYSKLQEADRYSLGILALLVVPPNFDDWLHQDEDRLLSKGCMYFSVARDWPAIGAAQDTKQVKCDRGNILDVASLLGLMEIAAQAKAGRL